MLATVAGLSEAVALLDVALQTLPRYPTDIIVSLLGAVGSAARRQIEPLIENDDELRRLWEVIDLTLAVMTGIVRFGLATDPRGFDAIYDYELREWLRLNGASERSLDSAVIRASTISRLPIRMRTRSVRARRRDWRCADRSECSSRFVGRFSGACRPAWAM